MNALVQLYTLHGNPLAISPTHCFTWGHDPCMLPSFCEACQLVDFRNYRGETARDHLKAFALRANELASQWRKGRMLKTDSVERAYNFAVALGLLLYDGETYDQAEISYNLRVNTVQRVLTASFGKSS
jgi:hypothetical protein